MTQLESEYNKTLELLSEYRELRIVERDPKQKMKYGLEIEKLEQELQRIEDEIRDGKLTYSEKPKELGGLDLVCSYVQRISEETSKIELIGLVGDENLTLPVEKAYIPMTTIVDPPFRVGDLTDKDRKIPMMNVFQTAVNYKKRGVVLLGAPGAGKSTVARYTCWQLASGKVEPTELELPHGTIPILLRLGNLTTKGTVDLTAFLATETQDRLTEPSNISPASSLLQHPHLLWILDGLDEIVDFDTRSDVCRAIEKALLNRPGDYFLVTCREEGYKNLPRLARGFMEARVASLDDDQVTALVRRWHQEVCVQHYGESKRAQSRAAELVESILRIFEDNDDFYLGTLSQLKSNPLLLTILCIVHFTANRDLPRARVELYRACVTALLSKWRQEVRLSQGIGQIDTTAAQSILGRAAWHLHKNKDTSMSITEFSKIVQEPLGELSTKSGLGRDGAKFIERMRDDCGVLVSSKPGQCGFLHLAFQEYLAALYCANEHRVDTLVNHFGESWWFELTLLAVGFDNRTFCRRFFDELLRSNLAFGKNQERFARCLGEARYVVPAPFVATLNDPSTERSHKIEILHCMRHHISDSLLIVCLNLVWNEDVEIRDFAQEIVQKTSISNASIQDSLATLKDTNNSSQERALAVWQLAKFDAKECVDALHGFLDDQEPLVREIVTKTLSKLQSTFDLNEESRLSVDGKTGIVLVRIPAGEFRMGSTANPDESPEHTVEIRPFFLGRYPVTNEEYAAFLRENSGEYDEPFYWRDVRFNQPKQPVVGITWNEAVSYCRWAGLRLPTEAEWEYACRSGTEGDFSFPNIKEITRYAWIDENSDGNTHPVGLKRPNPWGLCDMHGNVWEWCSDWYDENYYSQSERNNPRGPESRTRKVLRGGTFFYPADASRSAKRDSNLPDRRSYDFGFRVARSL